MMDPTDSRQQAEIDQLSAAAKDNRSTDRLQWVFILGFALGLFAYVSLILSAALRTQGDTIRGQAATIDNLLERCPR